MATAQYGSIVVQLAGSIGGHTYARTAGPNIVKRKPQAPNTLKATRESAKQRMSFYATTWRTLTPAIRADWATYAATVTWFNSYGDPFSPTAMQAFLWVHLHFYLDDLLGSYAAPTDSGSATVHAITLDINSNDLRIVTIVPAIAANEHLFVSVWTPQSQSVANPQGRVLARLHLDSTDTAPITLYADYDTRFTSAQLLRALVSVSYVDADTRGSIRYWHIHDFTVA